MTDFARFRLRQLVSPSRPQTAGRGCHPAVALLLRLCCVALLAWIGYIHLHLWQEGYRHIPTNGPLFLLDAVAGFVLAAVLLTWPRPLAGLVSAGFVAGTILALVISLTVGLLGFNESISAYYVVLALVVESITLVILLAWTALVAWLVPGRS